MLKRRIASTPHVQKRIFPYILGVTLLLSLIGVFFIFESSSVVSFRQMGDSFYFMKRQIMNLAVALIGCIFFYTFDYKKLYFFSLPALLLAFFFLLIVLIPGIGTEVYGASRWISIGGFSFQPTEFAKLAVILYLCSWFLHKEKGRFLTFIVLISSMIGLIMIQPDLGTSIILFSISIIIYFLSGQSIAALIAMAPIAFGLGVLLITTSPYRMSRLMSFFKPTADPQGANYHVLQILISLASGGLLGKGFSSSRQKYQFLPEAHTDSIFAIIGEEMGLIGSVAIIGLYIFLIIMIFRVAENTHDRFGSLLASAVGSLFAVQCLLNLSGMVHVLPLTGVPLPFVSYGGSSLIVCFALTGIVLQVAKKSKQ